MGVIGIKNKLKYRLLISKYQNTILRKIDKYGNTMLRKPKLHYRQYKPISC